MVLGPSLLFYDHQEKEKKCSLWSIMKISLLSNMTFLLCEETSRHRIIAWLIMVAAVVINSDIMGPCDRIRNENTCPLLVTLYNRAIGSSSISVTLTSVMKDWVNWIFHWISVALWAMQVKDNTSPGQLYTFFSGNSFKVTSVYECSIRYNSTSCCIVADKLACCWQSRIHNED